LTLSFTLATEIGLGRERSSRQATVSGSVLEILMGDSRRLFANHFVTKADVYLHGGVYPSIFDQAQREQKSHLAKEADSSAHAEEEGHDEGEAKPQNNHAHKDAASGFLGQPKDWIDAFGRNFYPTQHRHLDERGNQREILPWLQLAAELNPNQPETYTLSAYWLRQHMGKVKEAEQFLRQGWRANPNSYEILFELGRLREDNDKDFSRARNFYELALKKWRASEAEKKEPDDFSLMQIAGRLARLEENQGQSAKALEYLELLRKVSPSPELIQRQIDELRAKSKPLQAL